MTTKISTFGLCIFLKVSYAWPTKMLRRITMWLLNGLIYSPPSDSCEPNKQLHKYMDGWTGEYQIYILTRDRSLASGEILFIHPYAKHYWERKPILSDLVASGVKALVFWNRGGRNCRRRRESPPCRWIISLVNQFRQYPRELCDFVSWLVFRINYLLTAITGADFELRNP